MKVYLLGKMVCECGCECVVNDSDNTAQCMRCRKPFPLPFIETDKPEFKGPQGTLEDVRKKKWGRNG